MEPLFSPLQLTGFFITGMLCLALPIMLFVFLRKLTGASFIPLLAGMALYFGVSIVRELIRGTFDTGDINAYYLKQAVLSGVLEETARFFAFSFLIKNYESREDSVSYGIGHGFYELASAGLLYIVYMYTGINCNSRGLAGMTEGLSPAEVSRMAEYVRYVAEINPLFQLAGSISAAVFHVAMSVIIFYAVRRGSALPTVPAAIVIHALVNYACSVSQFGLEVFITAFSAAMLGYGAYLLYGKLKY